MTGSRGPTSLVQLSESICSQATPHSPVMNKHGGGEGGTKQDLFKGLSSFLLSFTTITLTAKPGKEETKA